MARAVVLSIFHTLPLRLFSDALAYRVDHLGMGFILRWQTIAALHRLQLEDAIKQGCASTVVVAIFDAFGAASVMAKAARTRIRAMVTC